MWIHFVFSFSIQTTATQAPPTTTSTSAAICGDGIVQQGEACDDGNVSNNDACLNTCQVAYCGDGSVWIDAESCDDGNNVDDDGCNNSCELCENTTVTATTAAGISTTEAISVRFSVYCSTSDYATSIVGDVVEVRQFYLMNGAFSNKIPYLTDHNYCWAWDVNDLQYFYNGEWYHGVGDNRVHYI